MAEKVVYFRGLNGIRCIAALIVVVAHTGQYLYLFGLQPAEYYKGHWQSYAVTLFFVLSGYLITYLLLEEKQRTSTVNLKGFYLRRVLRIWPLYFLIIALALLLHAVAPGTGIPALTPLVTGLYALFLANAAMALQVLVASPLSPLWSVSVEEQFYAVWPVLVKSTQRPLRMLFLVVVGYLALKAAIVPLHSRFLTALVADTRIDCMAIGGFGAVILRQQGALLRWVYSRPAQIFCWLLFLYSTLRKPLHLMSFVDHELYAVTFMIIILNVSTNPATLVDLEKPVFDFMGKISYGLYIYHMLVIFCLSAVMRSVASPTWSCYAAIYGGVLVLTTLLAHLSFSYFERPFLRLKERFAVVQSTASVAEEPAEGAAVIPFGRPVPE